MVWQECRECAPCRHRRPSDHREPTRAIRLGWWIDEEVDERATRESGTWSYRPGAAHAALDLRIPLPVWLVARLQRLWRWWAQPFRWTEQA